MNKLLTFDFFPKIQQDQNYQLRRSPLGGLLFMISILIILTLIINEIVILLNGGLEVY